MNKNKSASCFSCTAYSECPEVKRVVEAIEKRTEVEIEVAMHYWGDYGVASIFATIAEICTVYDVVQD